MLVAPACVKPRQCTHLTLPPVAAHLRTVLNFMAGRVRCSIAVHSPCLAHPPSH